jgi:hypothetical protein
MSQYNTQQTVHLLPLPFDSADYINSFLFIRIETKIKDKKREIVKKFENACYSRKNHLANEPDEGKDNDSTEHWALCLSSTEDDTYDENQFQAVNCGICGNYKEEWFNSISEMCQQIKCKC